MVISQLNHDPGMGSVNVERLSPALDTNYLQSV
jgi:hypothetical protein